MTALLTPATLGQNFHWNNQSGGSFQTASNWTENFVPFYGSYPIFDLNATYTVSLADDVYMGGYTQTRGNVTLNLGGHNWYTVTYNDLFSVAAPSGQTASLTVTNGTLLTAGAARIAQSGGGASVTVNGVWSQANLSLVNTISVGGSSTGGALLVTNGGQVNVAGAAGSGITVSGGASQLYISSGSVSTPNLTLAAGAALYLDSGQLTIDGGTFDNQGGVLALTQGAANSSARLTLNGARVSPESVVIGSAGLDRTLWLDNAAALTTTATSYIGAGGAQVTTSGFLRTFMLVANGSSWTHSGGPLNVGVRGSGRLLANGGGVVSTANTAVNIGDTSSLGLASPQSFVGDVTLSGGTLNAGSGGITVGANSVNLAAGGRGTLAVNNGGSVTAGSLAVGAASHSVGTVTVGDNGITASRLTVSGGISVGQAGTGTLTVNANGVVTADALTVGSGGTVNLSGGTLNLPRDIDNGGTVNHTAGTLNYTADVNIFRPVVVTGGTLSAAAGKTAAFIYTTMTGGTLAGPGTFITNPGGAYTTFTAVTTAPSATLRLDGTDAVVNSTLGGVTTIPASGYTPTLTRTTNTASGRLTVNSTAQLNVADFANTGQVTLADGTSTSDRTRVTNTGTSDLYFGGGSRTFVGTPSGAAAGNLATLNLGGKNAVVAGGLLVNNGVVSNGTVIADYGALVKGAGTFATLPVTQNGGSYQPGNSPGRSTVGSATLAGGGQLNFQINNATGVAGPTPNANNQVSGWGLVISKAFVNDPDFGTTTGDLAVTATPTSKYTLKLQTLQNPSAVGQDNFGSMANFDAAQPGHWRFLTYEGTYSGPADPNGVFNIDVSQFQNATNGGTFSITLDQTNKFVELTFTPVPEPASVVLVGAVGLLAFARRRLLGRK